MKKKWRSGGRECDPDREKPKKSGDTLPTCFSNANGSSGPFGKVPSKSPKMRLFLTYEGKRATIDVSDDQTVCDVKEAVRDIFNVGPDPGPGGLGRERKILTLYYMGSDLSDDWIMHDVGIRVGDTIKIQMKDEVKPLLYIHSAYSGETVPILEKFQVPAVKVSDLRTIASRKTGMPIGVFRLLNKEGKEMYDCNTLSDYQIEYGDTIRMETWDGWNDFLNLATKGFTSHVLGYLSNEELVARYQMKVALYIAAHFGHVDLAVSLQRQGVRPDEVVGDHPSRQWCRGAQLHIDALKTAVHVSAEQGQLGVLRSFVHHSVCNVLAKDGNGLTPLNVALRTKQKHCASFLLTKQWSKINYTPMTAIPLNIFVKMKRWSERAKDKVIVIHGQWKSSLKNPKRHIVNGALVGHGVILDGFSSSKMTSKAAALMRHEEERENQRKQKPPGITEDQGDGNVNPEAYFRSLGVVQTLRLPKLSKWNRIMKSVDKPQGSTNVESEGGSQSDSEPHASSPGVARRDQHDEADNKTFKLPPIREASQFTTSLPNLASGYKTEPEFRELNRLPSISRSSCIPTGHEEGRKPQLKSQTSQEADSKMVPGKKNRFRDMASDVLLAKTRTTEGSMLLPAVSNGAPRPFVKASKDDVTRQTLFHYERYRGLKSRDYAIRCLAVANTFKERSWLHQVRQAMSIASQGVRKTVTRRPHLFNSGGSFDDTQDSKETDATIGGSSSRSDRDSAVMTD